MHTISLTKGMNALVDDEDFKRVSEFKWTFMPKGTGYASRNSYLGGGRKNSQRKTVLLHRFILDAPSDLSVDHINGNGLDCRKENLRICTHAENTRNKRKSAANTSGYTGVYADRRRSPVRYQAAIRFNGKLISLKYHKTKEEAARAYNNAAVKYFGDFARLNNLENI